MKSLTLEEVNNGFIVTSENDEQWIFSSIQEVQKFMTEYFAPSVAGQAEKIPYTPASLQAVMLSPETRSKIIESISQSNPLLARLREGVNEASACNCGNFQKVPGAISLGSAVYQCANCHGWKSGLDIFKREQQRLAAQQLTQDGQVMGLYDDVLEVQCEAAIQLTQPEKSQMSVSDITASLIKRQGL